MVKHSVCLLQFLIECICIIFDVNVEWKQWQSDRNAFTWITDKKFFFWHNNAFCCFLLFTHSAFMPSIHYTMALSLWALIKCFTLNYRRTRQLRIWQSKSTEIKLSSFIFIFIFYFLFSILYLPVLSTIFYLLSTIFYLLLSILYLLPSIYYLLLSIFYFPSTFHLLLSIYFPSTTFDLLFSIFYFPSSIY